MLSEADDPGNAITLLLVPHDCRNDSQPLPSCNIWITIRAIELTPKPHDQERVLRACPVWIDPLLRRGSAGVSPQPAELRRRRARAGQEHLRQLLHPQGPRAGDF